jgi:hypothetical protein
VSLMLVVLPYRLVGLEGIRVSDGRSASNGETDRACVPGAYYSQNPRRTVKDTPLFYQGRIPTCNEGFRQSD